MDTDVEPLEEIVMDRYTQFKGNFPPLRAPRWHDQKLIIQANVAPHNRIVVVYTRPDGTRMFPEPLYISGYEAKKYRPFEMATAAGGTIRVRAIPINKFKVLKIAERSIHDLY